MSGLARWVARRIWWILLWTSRRNWARRLQAAALRMVREERREAARRSIVAQNRFARKYGLAVLTLSVNLVFASVILTSAFLLALRLQEIQALSMPDELRDTVLQKRHWQRSQ